MKKNVYLFQPEISSGTRPEHYLPYSVGCIWAYCNQFEDIQNNYELKDVIWKRERQKDVLDRIEDPVVCAFSCYVWNENWNLTCAKRIKERWPECIIVFGGPSVNENWTKHEFIDVAMFGEGEEKWAELLHKILNNEALDRYWNNPRQKEIEDYPSPYVTGFFDKIIADNPGVFWFMMLETNRGCPYHCTFCGWGASYLNKLKTFAFERVQADIEWAITHNIHWIFPIDANSGILRERDVEIAHLIRKAILDPRSNIRRVTFNHAKNLNPACFEMEKIIQEWTYGLEVAIQSLNVDTLKAVKRFNMGLNNIEKTYAECNKHGIRHYTELVLGLPYETKDTYINGLMKLLELGQHNSVKTYLATVIPNSEMDDPAYQEKYGIKLIHPKDLYRRPEERIWDEEDGSEEVIAMVSATNTASSQDLADCLSFSWVLTQFHYAGYSQIVAQYLNNIAGVSYREFYDFMYEEIKSDEWIGGLQKDVEEIMLAYLVNGEIPPESKWGNIVALTLPESYGTQEFFAHKDYVINLVIKIANKLIQLPKCIEDLQYAFMKDENKEYPYFVNSTVDIDRWTEYDCVYEVKDRSKVSHQTDQMYKKFLHKTDLYNTTNPYKHINTSEITKEQEKSLQPVSLIDSKVEEGSFH